MNRTFGFGDGFVKNIPTLKEAITRAIQQIEQSFIGDMEVIDNEEKLICSFSAIRFAFRDERSNEKVTPEMGNITTTITYKPESLEHQDADFEVIKTFKTKDSTQRHTIKVIDRRTKPTT